MQFPRASSGRSSREEDVVQGDLENQKLLCEIKKDREPHSFKKVWLQESKGWWRQVSLASVEEQELRLWSGMGFSSPGELSFQ